MSSNIICSHRPLCATLSLSLSLFLYHCCSRYWCFVPALFGIIALICSGGGTLYCQTISFTSTSTNSSSSSYSSYSSSTIESNTATTTKTTLYAGIFYYRSLQAPYECISYDGLLKQQSSTTTNNNIKKIKKDIYDVKWRISKAFSSLSLIVGGILTILVILIPCGRGGRGVSGRGGRYNTFWKCSGWIFLLLLTTFQGLSLFLLNSNACKASSNPAALQLLYTGVDSSSSNNNNNNISIDGDCEWEAGLRLLVVAIVAYAMAGITILILPESTLIPPELRQPTTRQLQVTYQRTVDPDGTTTVEKVQEQEV